MPTNLLNKRYSLHLKPTFGLSCLSFSLITFSPSCCGLIIRFPSRVLFHHKFIDLLFLFQTLRELHSSQKSRDISEEYGERWIKFSVGEELWEIYRLDGGVEKGKVVVTNWRTGLEVWSWKEGREEICWVGSHWRDFRRYCEES